MNIVNKLTLRHLKENKSRSIITTLGICVSVAMITAVFVAGFSLVNLLGELSVFQSGYWHAESDVATEKSIALLKSDDRIDKIGFWIENNEYYIFDENKVVKGFLCATFDKNLFEMKKQASLEGRLPTNKSEIIISRKALNKYYPSLSLGSKITLTSAKGKVKDDNTVYYTDKQDSTFTIVGILEENNATQGYDFIKIGFESDIAACIEKNGEIQTYFTLKDPGYTSGKLLKEIAKDYDLGSFSGSFTINKDLLISYFSIESDSFVFVTLLPLCLVCLLIIMFASVLLIYNAFGMSLSERVRYLGMLSSVGATKRQKRNSVYYEGLLLGAIGIPIGLIAGIAGISITLHFVGDKIISSGILSEAAKNAGMKFKTIVSPIAIVLIVLFSAITIFISLYIPAKKASKITPIDAIRQKSDYKLNAKKIKTSRLVRLVFGYEGVLAKKSLKRNGRKTRMITASIALSLILFLTVNYFCQMLVQSGSYSLNIPYQVTASTDFEHIEETKETIENTDGVDRFYPINYLLLAYSEEERIEYNEDYSFFNDESNYTKAYKSVADSLILAYYFGIDDEDFNSLCESNNIDPSDYYGQNELKYLIMDDLLRDNSNPEVFDPSVKGKQISKKYTFDEESYYLNFSIGEVIKYSSSNYACNLSPKGSVALFAPESEFLKYIKDFEKETQCTITQPDYQFGIETKEHDRVFDSLDGMAYIYAEDYAQNMQMINSMLFAVQVFVYGFIVLITMIAIANIINTISTGIAMRRKEFAMLKSVGTTPKGFNKMVCLESFFYGANSILIAYPISIALSYAMNRIVGESAIPFSLNIWMYISAAAVVFLIVAFSMLYSVKMLKNDSIVETLKTEIS